MPVRINLEIGHEASVRTKKTPENYTHDWEVFVRGVDNANIQHYVEKVVFYLHDTFKNPKRVKKEPPYVLKESGYAGFVINLELHLRTKEDIKRITFEYDITLQKSGPPIFNNQKVEYVFNTPSEEFKQKLLKGGGVVVQNSQDGSKENRTTYEEKPQLLSKPKLGGSDYTKKHKPKVDNHFQELFGTPITKTTKIIETKPVPKDKSIASSSTSKPGSAEKDKEKYSPYKEKDRERYKEKAEFSKKDKDEKRRDDKKERSKDREKKERRDKSPRSPTPQKRSTSPKRPPSPVLKYKEEKREVQKRSSDESKEKKIKKDKRDKEKYESKHKDNQNQKIVEQKEKSLSNKEKLKETSPLVPPKLEKKEKINLKDFIKETENGRFKPDKIEEKVKHKHKKKDKERDKDIEKEKYKSEKKSVTKQPEKQSSLFDSPKKSEKVIVLPECNDSDASNSSNSSPESSFKEQPKTYEPQPIPSPLQQPSPSEQKLEKPKKEKKYKDKKDDERKRKRKSEQKQIGEQLPKLPRNELSNLNNNVDSDNEMRHDSERGSEHREENCEAYMNTLKDLQHKILTLEDNTGLQRVVELIAETGRYEVSAQTFDFDLCSLERSTISQLQTFFESTS